MTTDQLYLWQKNNITEGTFQKKELLFLNCEQMYQMYKIMI